MAYLIQLRRDTSANWDSANPILAQGEVGLNLTNGRIKIGNGVTAWVSLPYFQGSSYEHTQDVASDEWTINHNLGFNPTCQAFSPGGIIVGCDVAHISINQTRLIFSTPVTGYARLL